MDRCLFLWACCFGNFFVCSDLIVVFQDFSLASQHPQDDPRASHEQVSAQGVFHQAEVCAVEKFALCSVVVWQGR
jgi:hypothetical protein